MENFADSDATIRYQHWPHIEVYYTDRQLFSFIWYQLSTSLSDSQVNGKRSVSCPIPSSIFSSNTRGNGMQPESILWQTATHQ